MIFVVDTCGPVNRTTSPTESIQPWPGFTCPLITSQDAHTSCCSMIEQQTSATDKGVVGSIRKIMFKVMFKVTTDGDMVTLGSQKKRKNYTKSSFACS